MTLHTHLILSCVLIGRTHTGQYANAAVAKQFFWFFFHSPPVSILDFSLLTIHQYTCSDHFTHNIPLKLRPVLMVILICVSPTYSTIVKTTRQAQFYCYLKTVSFRRSLRRPLLIPIVSVLRYKTGEELVSHDPKCNVFNYKHTYSVEIVPICKDEIVCLSPKLAQHLGNIGQVCIVYRVTQSIHIIDPNTCQSKLSWQRILNVLGRTTHIERSHCRM